MLDLGMKAQPCTTRLAGMTGGRQLFVLGRRIGISFSARAWGRRGFVEARERIEGR